MYLINCIAAIMSGKAISVRPAINPPDFVQQELHLKKTDASLKISRHAISYGDEVIEYRHRYVNTRMCKYQNHIGLKE